MKIMASSPPNTRTVEKILEEAEFSGGLNLSNRRLKDISQFTPNYNLADVTEVNLTKNRLTEIPQDAYEWQCIDTLLLSYNSIKFVSEFISEFKLLHVLDLSNNLLTALPPQLCELNSLAVLRVSNNKLISLPDEIGRLRKCQELDVSSNELTSLPAEIGQMSSLLFLSVRKNSIFALPEELSKLKLSHFDAGCNLISGIPLSFRNMTSLRTLLLDGNPFTNPSLSIVRKGQVHLFRELLTSAEKAQIKREVMDDPLMSPMKRKNVKTDINVVEMKTRALSISDTRELATEKYQNAEKYAEKAAELTKDRRKASVTNASPEKKLKQKNPEKKKQESPEKAKQNENVPSPPSQNVKPSRAPKPVPRGEFRQERKRSASSGNFERKNSKEALLIHQKLSGFPGYKTHIAEKTDVISNSNGNTVGEEKTNTKEKLHEFVKNRQTLGPAERVNQSANSKKGIMPAAIKPRSHTSRLRGSSFNNDKDLSFTMRRKTEKLYEELEMMENLRQSIEARLKVTLDDDLPAALSDGVVLCHLTNHVRPRSLSSIHVPSPAVPKLTLAKRRRNIDNFLDACMKIGVRQGKVCSAQDILLEKNIAKVAQTVNELLRLCPGNVLSPKRQPQAPTVKVTPSAVSVKQHSAV